MSKQQNTILPGFELPLKAALEAMANEAIDDTGEETDANPLEFYGEFYMENLSEAGYTETRPDDRLSIRTFAHLVRVKADDLIVLKNTLGFRPGSVYHDFAVSDNIISALSRNADVAPALHLLAPAEDAKSVGPFYPNRRTFDAHKALKAQGNYAERLKSVALQVGNSVVDNAAVQLAGTFNFTNLSKLAADLSAAGVQSESLPVAVAHAALGALRSDTRLTAGLRSAQASKKD